MRTLRALCGVVALASLVAGCGGGSGGADEEGGAPPPPGGDLTPDGGFEPLPLTRPSFVKPAPGEYPEVQRTIPAMALRLDPADLAALEEDPYTDALFPAVVTLDGNSAPAQVRFRGASTRELPQKSWKVELLDGYHLDGRDHFELLAEYLDAGKLTEKFIIDVFLAMGLPVPPARYVTVAVNGRHQGLYLDMMHVGGEYLAWAGFEPGTDAWRAGGRNGEMKLASAGPYQQEWLRRGSTTWGPGPELVELLRFINRTDDADFERGLPERIALDAYLGNLAADALVSNNLLEDARGYWMHEWSADRWTYVPWDLNNALSLFYRSWEPTDPPIVNRDPRIFTVYDPRVEKVWNERKGVRDYQPTWSVLNTRIWDRPALRQRVVSAIRTALDGPFSESRATGHARALWAAIRGELYGDPYLSAAHADRALGFLEQYIRGRRSYLQGMLGTLEAHGGGDLVINEVGFDAAGGYVELYNRGSTPFALAGKAITDDLRLPQRHVFGALTVPAQGHLVLYADGNPAAGPEHLAFKVSAEGGELGVFDGVRVWGPYDVVYFGAHASGSAYGRSPSGSETFKVLRQSPGTTN